MSKIKPNSKTENENTKETSPVVLPSEMLEIIEKLPEEDREKALIEILSVQKFSGPLPPPSILREYNDVIPGTGEVLIDSFLTQGNHRRSMEKYQIEAIVNEGRRGQIFGFSIALIVLAMAFASVLLGHTVFAITLASTTIIALVSVFVIGKWDSKNEKSSSNDDEDEN